MRPIHVDTAKPVRLCVAMLLLFLPGAGFGAEPSSAQDNATRTYDISAGDPATALNRFAEQSGLQVLFDADLAKGWTAPAVQGRLGAREALARLLQGSELEPNYINGRTVILRRAEAAPASAETPTGTLTGRVTQAGEPVAGVTVTATSEALEESRVVTTDDEGNYELTNLPPGEYSLRFEFEGLVSVVKEAEVSPEESTTLDIQMSLYEVREEVVVTGSHIRGTQPPLSAPLQIYDRDDISRTGAATVDQFLRTLPQNLASVDPIANAVPQQDPIQSQGNAFRGGGVNLHGLGFNTTLVLLNGHRVAPGGSVGGFSDVTLIPVSAIERVEVLSSGASAIYGADAVAGVVNFVLRDDFDGAEAMARYGVSTEGGAPEYGGSVAFGRSWNGGNALGIYDHLDQSGLQASERSFVSPDVGTRALIPSGRRNSIFLTAKQRVSPRVQLHADTFYSDRDFIDDSVTFGGLFVTHTEGEVEQGGFAPGATIDLGDDWQIVFAGNYSRLQQATTTNTDFEGFPPSVGSRDRVTEVSNLDIVADGSLLTLPGGELSAAVGVSGLTEKTDDSAVIDDSIALDTGVKRDRFAIFGELRVPIIAQDNALAFVEQLELSIAGRYDRYSKGGSKTTPQVGLSWSPVIGANIRNTYGQSFRVPLLEQLVGTPSFLVFPIPNSASPTGSTNTIVDATPFNADLGPERSTAYTMGFDLDTRLVPHLSLSATYFRIRFKDRIAEPIITSGLFNLFNELDQFGTFVQFNPSQTEVDAIFDSGFLEDPFGLGRSNVGAIFDSRLKNLTKSTSEGIDVSARYDSNTHWGDVGVSMSGSYLLALRHKLVPTTPSEDRVGTIFNPPDFKLRGGMDWSRGNFGGSFAVNYTDAYINALVTPNERVDSWTTGDVQLAYRVGGLPIFLNIINVTDERPPSVVTPPPFVDIGFDPANASPLGRSVSLRVLYEW